MFLICKEVGGRVNSFSFVDSNSVDDNNHHPKSYEIEVITVVCFGFRFEQYY